MSYYLNVITENPLGILEFTFPDEEDGLLSTRSITFSEYEHEISALKGLHLYETDHLCGCGSGCPAEKIFDTSRTGTAWADVKFSELSERERKLDVPYFNAFFDPISDYRFLYDEIINVNFYLTFISRFLPKAKKIGFWDSFDRDNFTDEEFQKNVSFLPEVKLENLCANNIFSISEDKIRFFTL